MAQLHEILAVEGNRKAQAETAMREVLGLFIDAPGQFDGMIRTYHPSDEDGETFPDETQLVQKFVISTLNDLEESYGAWIDVAFQKEMTNAKTSADIVVEGKTLAEGICAPALLNLEGKLTSLRKVFDVIPVVDASEDWSTNLAREGYSAQEKVTFKTRKVERFVTVAEATPQHPAQVAKKVEDVRIGEWHVTPLSGALLESEKRRLLERLDTLIMAVKQARQRANTAEVETSNVISQTLFDFLWE